MQKVTVDSVADVNIKGFDIEITTPSGEVQVIKDGAAGRVVHARRHDHYAYWPNGAFGIQARRNQTNRGN